MPRTPFRSVLLTLLSVVAIAVTAFYTLTEAATSLDLVIQNLVQRSSGVGRIASSASRCILVPPRVKFSVPVLSPSVPGSGFANLFFAEVVGFTAFALRSLGLDANTPLWPECLSLDPKHNMSCAGRVSVITFYCYDPVKHSFANAANLVLFNMEVVDNGQRACFVDSALTARWNTAPVWDYAWGNIGALVRKGFLAPSKNSSAVVPLSYFPSLDAGANGTPPSSASRTIDVLMLATPNYRRNEVIRQLAAKGVTVATQESLGYKQGVWGEEKDRLIRSAKVVLNVHFYDARLMESVRLFHLLSLGACVVSEDSPDLEAVRYWRQGMSVVPYGGVADRVVYLLRNETARIEVAAAGAIFVRSKSPGAALLPALRSALTTLSVPHSEAACDEINLQVHS